jgi:hypothetical protein
MRWLRDFFDSLTEGWRAFKHRLKYRARLRELRNDYPDSF